MTRSIVLITLFIGLMIIHCIGKDVLSKIKDTKEFEKLMINTYKHAKSCLRAVHQYDLIPPTLNDLTSHHHELLEITKQYRGLSPHHHDSHTGMWIENHFIDHFLNKSITTFGGFIPLFVQWIDYDLHVRDKLSSNAMFATLLSKLRHDVAYIAVSQDNNGIPILIEKFPNVIILSAGGNGNIPIPLIMGDLPYIDASNKQLSIEVGFYGNLDHGIRKEIFHEMKPLLLKYNLSNSLHSSPHWIQLMDDTLFNLAPQGFGRTSFRLAEVVQVGRIPVYIYNDIPWVPYVGSPLSVYELGYVGRVHHLESLIKHLANIKHDKSFNSEINQKLEKVKLARDSYTYTGVMNQIALFFEFPFSRQHSSLVCSHDLHAASKTASSVLDIQLE